MLDSYAIIQKLQELHFVSAKPSRSGWKPANNDFWQAPAPDFRMQEPAVLDSYAIIQKLQELHFEYRGHFPGNGKDGYRGSCGES